MTLAWMLGVNIIGGGIFGLLLNLPNPGRAVLIYQALLFVIIGFLVLRSQINGTSQKLAAEGFWQRVRARARPELRGPVDVRRHPREGRACPGRPVRVLTGVFGGVPGSLHGHRRRLQARRLDRPGRRRPTGPIATADFDVSAPGASATALDAYVGELGVELRTQRRRLADRVTISSPSTLHGRQSSPSIGPTAPPRRLDLALAVGAGVDRAGGGDQVARARERIGRRSAATSITEIPGAVIAVVAEQDEVARRRRRRGRPRST